MAVVQPFSIHSALWWEQHYFGDSQPRDELEHVRTPEPGSMNTLQQLVSSIETVLNSPNTRETQLQASTSWLTCVSRTSTIRLLPTCIDLLQAHHGGGRPAKHPLPGGAPAGDDGQEAESSSKRRSVRRLKETWREDNNGSVSGSDHGSIHSTAANSKTGRVWYRCPRATWESQDSRLPDGCKEQFPTAEDAM